MQSPGPTYELQKTLVLCKTDQGPQVRRAVENRVQQSEHADNEDVNVVLIVPLNDRVAFNPSAQLCRERFVGWQAGIPVTIWRSIS